MRHLMNKGLLIPIDPEQEHKLRELTDDLVVNKLKDWYGNCWQWLIVLGAWNESLVDYPSYRFIVHYGQSADLREGELQFVRVFRAGETGKCEISVDGVVEMRYLENMLTENGALINEFVHGPRERREREAYEEDIEAETS